MKQLSNNRARFENNLTLLRSGFDTLVVQLL